MLWEDHELISDLGREECVRRLQSQTDPPGTFFSKKPVIGYVDERGLEIRKRIHGRNAFQPWLIGEIVDEGGRTRLRFHFAMSPFVTAFMAIWFSFLLFAGGSALIAAIRSLPSGAHQMAVPLGPLVGLLLMLAAGVAITRVGRRNQERFLIDFLRDTLDAREG